MIEPNLIPAGTRDQSAQPRSARPASARSVALALSCCTLLSACARQSAEAVSSAPDAPGFLLGLWHGFIFPLSWVLSLFLSDVAVYAVPNNGGWYDFGYFLGIVVFGVGARKTKTVTVVQWKDRW